MSDSTKKHQWIDDSIDISSFYDKLPQDIKNLISDAERAEKNELVMEYYDICEIIEIRTKMMLPEKLSHKEWELLCSKYSFPYNS